MTMWLCRTGKYGEYENRFLEDNRIYCTRNDLPISIKQFETQQELHQYFVDVNPDTKIKTAINWASQIWPFAHEMTEGEIVILPSKKKPNVFHFGKILSDYEFLEKNESPYNHSRRVKWFVFDFPRSKFDLDIQLSLNSAMTICRISQEDRVMKFVQEYQQGKQTSQKPKLEVPSEEETLDIENEAIDVITDLLLRKTKGHGLAKIVDAILRAKGFTTYVSPPGSDKGVDILASSGTLGFGSPKICVQVKSSDTPVDRKVLDELVGVTKNFKAEYGLLVSWSGFKSSITRETAQKFFEIRFWTHKEIVEEFLRYYDQMDDEIKELIPLKRIWVVNRSVE